jgi:hypothetical protein
MRQPAPPLHADAAMGAVTSTGLPVAELANRLRPRRLLVDALAYEVGHAHIEMERELVVHIVANLGVRANGKRNSFFMRPSLPARA